MRIKKLISLTIVSIAIMLLSSCNTGKLCIDEKHFPDYEFRSYVKRVFDITGDGYLDEDEISKAVEINRDDGHVKDKYIYSFKGIEYLTSLERLFCSHNKLDELDVSKCTQLKYISCGNNNLTSLNVDNCINLETLYCYNNRLTSLDISKCTQLESLDCGHNDLTSLDVSKCTELSFLKCSGNNISYLDISNCTSLGRLSFVYDDDVEVKWK